MKKLLLSLLLLCGALGLDAQTKYKVYDYLPLPRPEGLPEVTAADFRLDRTRLALYPDGVVFASPETLAKLFDYFRNDADGQEQWAGLVKSTAQTLNKWDYNEKKDAVRYINSTSGSFSTLALVYLFTGNRTLLRYVRDHLTQLAGLPLDFWLHAELRGMNEKFPVGGLETARLSRALGYLLSATGQDLPKDELAGYEKAYREKGYQPCLNWLEKPRVNNWTAVLGTGAFVASKYFKDPEGGRKALDAIAFYLNGTIEDDGSYGEGYGYFSYPIGQIMMGILSMNDSERDYALGNSGLRHSSAWRVYLHLFQTDGKGRPVTSILNFGDNSYLVGKNQSVNATLTALYRDPMALWLTRKFGGSYGLFEQLLLFSLSSELPEPLSPAEANLPTTRVFDSGDCFIRSSWEDNAIVLGMRSGGGSKVKYTHQRPEKHSIAMGAYGEYFIVGSGSASYRSPIHYAYDKTTRAANTIEIDGKNQLFPGRGVSFIKFDNTAWWVTGEPKAEVFAVEDNERFALIGSDARAAYHIPMREASRTVKFVRDPGFFVVVDRMTAGDSLRHTFVSRLHLNNGDGNGKLTQAAPGLWRFERLSAGLTIAFHANCPTSFSEGEGYMHGGGARDYSPGGPNEGKPGSAIEMTFANTESRAGVEYVMVLFPTRPADKAPDIRFADGKLSVNGVNIEIPQGRVIDVQ